MTVESINPSPRQKAVESLIESLRNRFPEKGFLLHPSVRFVTGDQHRGILAMARESIPRSQTLLVVPKSTMLESNVKDTPDELKPLFKKLTKKFQTEHQRFRCSRQYIFLPDVLLAVGIMNVLFKRAELNRESSSGSSTNTAMDPFCLQADTWPLEDELKESYFGYRTENEVQDVWGYKSGLTMDWVAAKENLEETFEKVVYPLLKKEADGGKKFIDDGLPSNRDCPSTKEKVRNTFWYAHGLAFSRAHGTHDSAHIMPLVDLFNGDVEGANQSTINIATVKGQWPFLGGGAFRNECNLPCSCVYALRNIKAGEELVISYGENMTVSEFQIKYGAVPKSLLDPSRSQCDIRLWCDPSFIPKENLRIACLKQSGGFPVEELETSRDCALTEILAFGENRAFGQSQLDLYLQGHEDGAIMSMRQYLILAVLADDFELKRNLETGRLRGIMYYERVLPLMCQMIDYNIGLLQGANNSVTSSKDMQKSNLESTPAWKVSFLLARVAYRETLLAWRHAFVQKAIDMFGASCGNLCKENSHPCLVDDRGCGVCGRSYPSLRCSRCKIVQYCTREHQKLDWKYHKKRCIVSSTK